MHHDHDQCWHIFQQKNSDYDGVFVVGVMSTKIYCRPSCSARPHRKNVQFFADNASAERAGLRPCKRCTPNSIAPEHELCQRVCRYVESQRSMPSLTQIAHAVGYSRFHLQRTFKQVMGISPFAYAQTIKWLRVQELLSDEIPVLDAIARAGFGSISGYYHAHTQHRIVRNVRNAESIHIGKCLHHGFVVMGIFHAQTIQYCGVYVDDANATTSIQRLLGVKELIISTHHSNQLHAMIQAQTPPKSATSIDNDFRATAFQHRVWHAIRQIPIGETRHYDEIAQEIGQPTASRAVANACAHNPLAIITPCHRVVPRHGSIGKYRWGADIKVKLLDAEHAATYNGEE